MAVLAFMPAEGTKALKAWMTAVTVINCLLVIPAVLRFQIGRPGFQLVEKVPWVPSIGINYYLGVDGFGIAMVALAGMIFVVAALASYSPQIGSHRVKEYGIMLLFVETAAMGVFTSLDYILFFLFWEMALIPSYFMIAIWGGHRREYAAMKFLIYTLVGSALMLVGIIALYLLTGGTTFSIPDLAEKAKAVSGPWLRWLFLAFFAGFAVKVPLWPFHTWLPDAHGEAPTPVHVLLAAILLKMGGYGFFRIALPTFPDVIKEFSFAIAVLGVFNIVYGALATMAYTHDFKRFVAYSSVSHMGFVMLGVAAGTPLALAGAFFEMISHGLIGPMLFLMVGVWYDRTHTLDMGRLSGMNVATPFAGTILTFAAMANLGLPGLSGFIAEFLVLLGSLKTFPILVYVTLAGLVLGAAFNLLMLHKVVMGRPREEYAVLPDLDYRELATLLPLAVGSLVLGVWPSMLMNLISGPVAELISRLGGV